MKHASLILEPATPRMMDRVGEQSPSATPKRRFGNSLNLLACALTSGTLLVGCETPCREESFSSAFDAQKVASLSHEAYKVAWHATFWARQNLRYAAFEPTIQDWEAVTYLDDISWQVPWIARKIEKNPATPRVSSKFSYDMVAYDAMMLRLRYQPTSFRQSTCAQVERLLRLVDEMAPYYSQKATPNRNSGEAQGRQKKG